MEKTMIIPSTMSFLCTLFLSYSYQGKKELNNGLSKKDKNSVPFWESIFQLIRNRKLVKISIFGFFLGIMANSINTHFSLFLFLDYRLPKIIAGLGFAFVQMGSILGRAAWGIFCDKV